MKPVSAVELFQATRRNNCRECGHATCLAFATQVIVYQAAIDACPHLDGEKKSELKARIEAQQQQGIFLKRDLYQITAEDIRLRLAGHDFSAIAAGLGAEVLERDGVPCLRLRYLHRDCLLSKKQVFLDGQPTGNLWDNVLLYNYAFMAGSEPLRGEWIPIDSIPGHIPKKPELEHGCEENLARHFAGNLERLRRAAASLGGVPVPEATHVDAAFTFLPLPRVPFYLLFWDHVPEEAFPARTKVLFDRSVPGYLDIESLVFLAERFADAFIEADPASQADRR